MNDTLRNDLEELKRSADLVDVLRRCGLDLRRRGKNWFARCPFHDDQEASLSVNSEAQLWNCFGCDAGGDAIRFLELHQRLDFSEAVNLLREWTGNRPLPEPPKPTATVSGMARSELLERVSLLYAARLKESSQAQKYLKGRGLGSRQAWEAFHLGYADGSLLKTLPESGGIRDALMEIGVLTRKGRELMSGCVVVPLSHPDQGVVGLYGRKVSNRAKVRHLYLPGPRRGVLNWQALRGDDSLLLTESVLDALSFWVAGVRQVSCLYGTQGFPEDLSELLGRYGIREVTLALDADEAGRQAVGKLGPLLTERGLKVFTLELESGQDPNQLLIDSGPEALRELSKKPLPGKKPAQKRKKKDPVVVTGDGYQIHFGSLVYQVTPRPPFTGRLRVLLRAETPEQCFRDTLDLYSHRARATAMNQVARQLGLPRETVEKHFLNLIDAGEAWVREQLKAREEEAEPAVVEVAPEDRQEALALLRSPTLVKCLLGAFDELGYVGETNGKLLGYLVSISRKLDSPLSAIIRSQSGAGKSGLASVVAKLTPPEDVIHYSRVSAQALAYVAKTFFKHKMLVMEERVGGEAADYYIRVLQSAHNIRQAAVVKDPTTGQMKTQEFEVEGPIAYLETTTDSQLNYENATRCFEIHLDETEEQTQRIHERQRQARSLERIVRTDQQKLLNLHHNAQRLLEPVRVVIPYVHLLSFPSRWLRTRRDNERFLCLIEALAFLHQYQRQAGQVDAPEGSIRYVEASLVDYELAYRLAHSVLSATLHELSRNARDLWAELKTFMKGQPPSAEFTRRQLRQHTRWPDRRLRESLEELVEMEYVAALSGSQGRAYQYRLLEVQDEPLPLGQLTSPEKLRELWKESAPT